MAVSRIGGTSGKLRGQLGNDIYQIKNNGDGTFTQIVYQKGERTETVFTPKLQAQRMCTGMVESLMKALKPLIGISFESGRTKTMSCNAFSAANIRLVQRDCMEHWYGNNKFVFPYYRLGYGDFSELGGPYMISSGTLNKNLFDANICDIYGNVEWLDMPYPVTWLYGLVFNCRIGIDTVESFRQAHKMTILDKVCFAGFRDWIDSVTDPDDPKHCWQHDWFVAEFNRSISSTAIMTPEVIKSLFKISGNNTPTIYISRDGSKFIIGQALDYHETNAQYYYWAGFSISHATGKKKISTSFYDNDNTHGEPYLNYRWPAEVFGSWMGEPQRKPYPSPFAPAPTPRLPFEYQEVTWVRRLSGAILRMPAIFKPMVAKLSFRFSGVVDSISYLFANNESTERLLLRIVDGANNKRFEFHVRGNTTSGRKLNFDISEAEIDASVVYEAFEGGYFGNFNEQSRSGTLETMTLSDTVRAFDIWGLKNYTSVCRIYEMVAIDVRDNSLMFDLVPCYRKSDGFCGFYDLVSSQFFTAQANAGEYDHGDIVIV